jgi:hypothetical protein
MSRVEAEKKKEAASKPEWDRTTTTSQRGKTVEDKMAAQIAAELLRDNQKLKAIHSNVSLKKLIE